MLERPSPRIVEVDGVDVEFVRVWVPAHEFPPGWRISWWDLQLVWLPSRYVASEALIEQDDILGHYVGPDPILIHEHVRAERLTTRHQAE